MKIQLWLSAALTLGACGGDDGGGAPIGFEDVGQQRAEATCQQFNRCGLTTSVAACVEALDLTPPGATLVAAVAAGKVTFDGGAARACFDAIAGAACEVTAVAYRARPLACLTLFQGSVAAGGACTIDEECVSQQCAIPSCDMACCPGTCDGDAAPGLAKAGEPCDHAQCDDASYCDQVDRTCMPLKAANNSCETFEECADGLYCLLSGQCGSLPAEGQTCDTDGCQRSNDYCSAATHLCTKAGVVGDACAGDSECATLYSCDNTRHCAAGIALDGPCRLGDRCVRGARCDVADGETTGLCHPVHDAGGACTTDADCTYRCDRDAGMCIADVACP